MTPRHPAAWLLCAALACCSGPETAPDPGFQLAERGIGGTGGAESGVVRPLPAPTGNGPSILPRLPADRGIGGTGFADTGTAGTGVAGTITGFGSIFVNGLEVGLEAASRITIDGVVAPLDAFQVGQVAVLSAGPVLDARSSTRAVAVRHEVAGRIAGMDKDGLLSVAGQPVRLSPSTLGIPAPQVGDWVTVSGLRNEAGEIVATRIDPSARGRVIVHGTMRRDRGILHIGALPIEAASGLPLPVGRSVGASGREVRGVLQAETLTPDLLVADPVAFFGPGVRYFLIESYARSAASGGIELEQGPHLSGPRSVFSPAFSGTPDGRSVIGFEREPDGALVATSMRRTALVEPAPAFMGGGSGQGGGPAYMPAPVPGRAGAMGASPGFMGGRGGANTGSNPGFNPGSSGGFANPGLHQSEGGPAGSFPPPGHQSGPQKGP